MITAVDSSNYTHKYIIDLLLVQAPLAGAEPPSPGGVTSEAGVPLGGVITSVAVPASTAAPTIVSAPPTVVTSAPAPAPGSAISESELIKNLETSAMASVAAARALEVGHGLGTRPSLHPQLVHIQQPLPAAILAPAPATATAAPRAPAAAPPPLTLPPAGAASSRQQPGTPLSADMEDAESQISQLLESLQQQQQQEAAAPPAPPPASDQEFFDSLPGAARGGVTPPLTRGAVFPSVARVPGSPSMPVLTPQVAGAATTPPQARLAAPPLLSPTTGLLRPQAGGVAAVARPGGVIQPVPRPQAPPSRAPPNVTVQTSGPPAGAGSQLRALQQLPASTQLQQGPGGQILVQKIQTIELSAAMQQQYKLLATRISSIEQKAAKCPQDEADLAELQAKQHQILSTGRPVFGQQLAQPAPALAPQVQLPAPAVPQGRAGAGVPPLTEQQKKIVAEFKSRMSRLPGPEQAAYIAQNKMNLIKQLDFKPQQLKMLQSTQPGPGAPAVPAAPPQLRVQARPQLGPSCVLPAAAQEAAVRAGPSHQLAIDKTKKVAWMETQLRNDQREATQPNYRTPFRSREDTCKRLLRYHVYNEETMTEADMARADEEFEAASGRLLARYSCNLAKYQLLLLEESMRRCSSSCEAMLGRVWVAEEKAALAREKESYRARLARLLELDTRHAALSAEERGERAQLAASIDQPDLPPIPDTWAARYEQVVGKPWKSYKQKFKRNLFNAFEAETEEENLHSDPQNSPDAVEIKKEPTDEDCEMEPSTRARRCSSNSDLFSDRGRSRSSSGGPAASRKEVRVNLANILDSSQARRELSDIAKSSPQSASEYLLPGDKNFVGLKFNRSMSGRWSASLKRDSCELGEEEEEGGHKRMRADPGFTDESSEDEDFSLADVGGNNAAVQSMLENDADSEEDCDELDPEDDELR